MNWQKITLGSPLKELRVTPSKTQLFMFSAITWNRHQIHFNKDQAIAEGFPDVAVQRGLIGNFLSRLVYDWAQPYGELEKLQWKVIQSAFPGQELCCQGQVIEVAELNGTQKLTCALQVINHNGKTVATGEAKVKFNKQKNEVTSS